ncbi:MAG: CHAT domain-containing protein [Terriglobia bacterium]|nr:CHAT domain-containing protein [Terriglobia bacterium]
MAALALSGCQRSMCLSPESTYEKIYTEFLRGDLGDAQLDAAEACKEFSGRNRNWDIKFRLLEAEILTYQGNSPRVEQLLSGYHPTSFAAADIEIKRQLLLSLAHTRLNQPIRSNHELQTAQQLSTESGSALQGELLQTEGLIAVHRDQLATASDSFKRSLEFARQHGDKFLETTDLMNLGTVALRSEEYDEALARFEDASQIARSTDTRLALELALGNAGWAYYKLGDFEKSLFDFQQAEQQARQLGSVHDQIVWATNSGLSFYRLGDLKSAEANYRRALSEAQAVNDKELIATTHTELGFLFFQRRQFDLAERQSLEALQAAHAWGSQSAVVDVLFLQGLLAARSKSGPDAIGLLMQVYRDPVTMPSLREEVENAVAKYYARVHNKRAAEVWFRKSVATFEAQRSSLKDDEMKLPFFANADSLYKDYAHFLIESHRSRDALQLLDRGRAQTLEEGLGITSHASRVVHQRSVNAQAVARKLNATILFYALCPEQSYLWAIDGHHIRIFRLPGKSEIDSHVKNYQRAILRSIDPIRQEDEDARYLFDTLVAPAAANLRKGARVVLISDGSLDELNFETLLAPGKTGVHYWIEDVTIANTNAIRLISALDSQDDGAGGNGMLLIGDPISPGSDYPRLLNAEAEIHSIEKHFAPDREVVLTRASAVPVAYTAGQPGDFSYIHFVAHGTASRLSPLDSAVILSPPRGHPDTFKLYAREIVHKPLHARLVTISTCYGSGLRAYAGEGLVGLSWAFLRAGAHNAIGALWEASDAAMPQLMDRLYSEIQTGHQPDAALRTAKLSLIHSQSVYRKPLYWAAFQLYAGG